MRTHEQKHGMSGDEIAQAIVNGLLIGVSLIMLLRFISYLII